MNDDKGNENGNNVIKGREVLAHRDIFELGSTNNQGPAPETVEPDLTVLKEAGVVLSGVQRFINRFK